VGTIAAPELGLTELERLGRCPVCGSAERNPAYQAVEDGVFGTSGKWDYWSCACGILYLDPRPAIGEAAAIYEHYYTHQSAGAPLRWRERGLRGAIRRGYLNARYGYRFADASWLAGVTWRLRRSAVKNLDYMIRHLPAPTRPGCRILDIGCGNGDFLAVAQDLGYCAIGLDPDPKAVAVARAGGLDARCGSVPGSREAPHGFTHVFMSHVLEHLDDPVAALREAQSLLAPGGRLWLSLPSLSSEGLQLFGPHWRGLEPPRHLTLFDPPRLGRLLAELGYESIELLPPEDAAFYYFRQSLAIRHGLDPYGHADPPGWDRMRLRAKAAHRRTRADPLSGECLTMIAFKAAP
jgi:SAM-dependent methyltransferase